uniref:Uncharacterized protein n=1 Tax=Anopheles culicifacies TaxID=139723 RepID=A0A182MP01_9DIPT
MCAIREFTPTPGRKSWTTVAKYCSDSVERVCRRWWNAELLNEFRTIDKQLDAMGARQRRTFRNSEVLYQMLLLTLCTCVAMIYSVNNLCDDNFYKLQSTFGRRIVKVSSKSEPNSRTHLVARMGLIYDELHSISLKISDRYKFSVRINTKPNLRTGYCILNVLYGIMAIYTFYRGIFVAGYEKRFAISIFLVWDIIYKLSLLQSFINCHLLQAEVCNTENPTGGSFNSLSHFD